MATSEEEFAELLKTGMAEAASVPPCTSLLMDEQGGAVELLTDTKAIYYGEWIKGEGADICLYRERETGRIVGCRLPMHHTELRTGRIKP